MSLVCCFSPQGRVWWDFSPCLGVAFTHPYSLCSPTLTLGGVNAGSPEALNRSLQPEAIWPVCELWVTSHFLPTPGWKHVNLQTLPRLQIRVAAAKKSGASNRSAVVIHFVDAVSIFDVSFWRRFFSAMFRFNWRLKLTTRWRRQRTKTPKPTPRFIRNEESDSSTVLVCMWK